MVDTGSKKLELLREVVPRLSRLAVMGNVGNPLVVLEMSEVETSARTFGLKVATSAIRRVEDFAPGFELIKNRADALYVASDPLLNSNRVRINTLALGARLPTMQSRECRWRQAPGRKSCACCRRMLRPCESWEP
jgi:putative tryptophan/tyrosine transport system substrate-binding protein